MTQELIYWRYLHVPIPYIRPKIQAYVSGFQGISPQKMALHGTVPPF